MSLYTKIHEDMIAAMRSGDEKLRDVLRLAENSIRNKAIELRIKSEEISDEVVKTLLSTQVKQRRESIRQYEEGGRRDLAEKERFEWEVLSSYLPKEVARDEIEAIVTRVVQESGASTPADMGKVMGAVMQEARQKGSVDGNVVRECVQQALKSL
jgi:uncharacterized protein YqeY